ncbi:hypothetical protein SynBIOSE41_03148 [Synechococcus sp. BIOS-E4-1]|nr:hypothetical protein SynBIOSE41_03148 [Synechococcus sp. BIOS-E4-1]
MKAEVRGCIGLRLLQMESAQILTQCPAAHRLARIGRDGFR